MATVRNYQEDFYASFEPIQSRDIRFNRASKLKFVIEKYMSEAELKTFICADLGCSAGVITAQLSPLFKTCIGIDYDRTGLAAIHPDDKMTAHFARSDTLYLSLANESVDIVICTQVYEHVANDVMMMSEIYRILRPEGYCLFTGPNWLFPIEPHYFLPFLHWLPEKYANQYLQLAGLGKAYYERSRTIWGLRKLFHRFDITDITIDILLEFYLPRQQGFIRHLRYIPRFMWKLMLPLFPNFNWVLRKQIE